MRFIITLIKKNNFINFNKKNAFFNTFKKNFKKFK